MAATGFSHNAIANAMLTGAPNAVPNILVMGIIPEPYATALGSVETGSMEP